MPHISITLYQSQAGSRQCVWWQAHSFDLYWVFLFVICNNTVNGICIGKTLKRGAHAKNTVDSWFNYVKILSRWAELEYKAIISADFDRPLVVRCGNFLRTQRTAIVINYSVNLLSRPAKHGKYASNECFLSTGKNNRWFPASPEGQLCHWRQSSGRRWTDS